MPIPFNPNEWPTLWTEVERCPFVWGQPGYVEWNREQDAKQLLNKLDRYAIALICEHIVVKLVSDFGLFQKCMKCGRFVHIS